MKLPTGENLFKNLHYLTDEQVEHEYNLCYEVINGVFIDGELIVEGLIHKDENTYPDRDAREGLIKAKEVWVHRMEIAWKELLERHLLS